MHREGQKSQVLSVNLINNWKSSTPPVEEIVAMRLSFDSYERTYQFNSRPYSESEGAGSILAY